jgi:tetratricopeptide (TPR) repeat protein
MLEVCDRVAQRSPAAGVAHLSIASMYIDQGELKPAVTLLERAIQLRPSSYVAHHRLGGAYRRQERYDDALREYQAAEKLAASAPAAQRSRLQIDFARLLADKGDVGGAAARYEKGLGLDAPASRGVELAKGLILHYTFDKDVSDTSGKGHHGTNQGATVVAQGKFGGALSLDGQDDHVAIPPGATQELEAWTFALWLQTAHAEAQSRRQYWSNPTLLGTSTPGYGSCDVGLMLKNGNVAYFHGLSADSGDVSWASTKAVNDGAWHHIALVNAGPLTLLYVDGRLTRGQAATIWRGISPLGVVSDTGSGSRLCSAPFLIGATNLALKSTRPTAFYRGLIDDLRIWNRPLRAQEVAALWAGAK